MTTPKEFADEAVRLVRKAYDKGMTEEAAEITTLLTFSVIVEQLKTLNEKVDALAARDDRAELASLRADRDRIDWIDQNMDCDLSGPGLSCQRIRQTDTQTLREAIDLARIAVALPAATTDWEAELAKLSPGPLRNAMVRLMGDT